MKTSLGAPKVDDLAHSAPPKDAPQSELQSWMAQLIRSRNRLSKSKALEQAARLHFTGNDRLSPIEQVDIYREQFWLRHTSALVEDFPGLTGLLDREVWQPIVESYLQTRGFDIFPLKNLGARMPEHIQDLPAQMLPQGIARRLLFDMARLECAYARAFDAGDDGPLDAKKLTQIPPEAWEGARFTISSSISLLELDYQVADLRRRIKKGEAVDRNALEKSPHHLVVYRRDRTLWDKHISRSAFLLLEQFHAGIPLVAACEKAIDLDPGAAVVFEEQLTEWFALWGKLGWIVDVTVPQNASKG